MPTSVNMSLHLTYWFVLNHTDFKWQDILQSICLFLQQCLFIIIFYIKMATKPIFLYNFET